MTDDAPALTQIIYASRACNDFDEGQLRDLLAASRANNQTLGLTGMLLYCEGSFFQVLEGNENSVRDMYERISRDPRHDSIVQIIEEAIPRRAFANWTMGMLTATRQQMSHLDGLNDFFASGQCLTQLDPGRSRKMLQAFRSGRWRIGAQ